MSSLYREQLETWLKKLDIDVPAVLDIGGGQLPIDKRVAFWNVGDYKIADNDKQYNPDYLFDLNSNPDEPNKNRPSNEFFDVIFCLEVMEYIHHPHNAHQNIFNALHDGGTAYISYPTLYPLHNPPGIDYLRYTKNAIEKYLSEAGFETWDIEPRIVTEGLNGLQEFWARERMRPMKGNNEVYDMGYLVKAYKGVIRNV